MTNHMFIIITITIITNDITTPADRGDLTDISVQVFGGDRPAGARVQRPRAARSEVRYKS